MTPHDQTSEDMTPTEIIKAVASYCKTRPDYKVVVACDAPNQERARSFIVSLGHMLARGPSLYILSMPTSETIKSILSTRDSAIALTAHDFPDRLLRYARVHRHIQQERISLLSVRLTSPCREQTPEITLYQNNRGGAPCLSASPFDPSAPAMRNLHHDLFAIPCNSGLSH